MVADAVHSLSDFVTDVVVIAFVHISGKPKDKSHDYGHAKYETLAMTVIGVALLVVAVGIVYGGIVKIVAWWNGQQLAAPGLLALWAALLSIVLKEGVYRYSMVKARQLESQAVEANAWHHRSDALSSIGTAVGIGGAIVLGQRWTVLDPVASVIVGAFIVKVAADLLRSGIGDLMNLLGTGDARRSAIRDTVSDVLAGRTPRAEWLHPFDASVTNAVFQGMRSSLEGWKTGVTDWTRSVEAGGRAGLAEWKAGVEQGREKARQRRAEMEEALESFYDIFL
jgi:divalent metal cation (Fe/Co/Zn/Cd) transporter